MSDRHTRILRQVAREARVRVDDVGRRRGAGEAVPDDDGRAGRRSARANAQLRAAESRQSVARAREQTESEAARPGGPDS